MANQYVFLAADAIDVERSRGRVEILTKVEDANYVELKSVPPRQDEWTASPSVD
jgi:hypothetical protein